MSNETPYRDQKLKFHVGRKEPPPLPIRGAARDDVVVVEVDDDSNGRAGRLISSNASARQSGHVLAVLNQVCRTKEYDTVSMRFKVKRHPHSQTHLDAIGMESMTALVDAHQQVRIQIVFAADRTHGVPVTRTRFHLLFPLTLANQRRRGRQCVALSTRPTIPIAIFARGERIDPTLGHTDLGGAQLFTDARQPFVSELGPVFVRDKVARIKRQMRRLAKHARRRGRCVAKMAHRKMRLQHVRLDRHA